MISLYTPISRVAFFSNRTHDVFVRDVLQWLSGELQSRFCGSAAVNLNRVGNSFRLREGSALFP